MDEQTSKALDIAIQCVLKTNEINKRCICAIIAMAIAMCVIVGLMTIPYFAADYDYGIVSQYQSSGEEQSRQIGDNYGENTEAA